MKKSVKLKRGISTKTTSLVAAIIILIAGVNYMTLSGNNPVSNAKISRIATDKDNIKTAITSYIYKVKVKSADKYYTNEDIILGREDTDLKGIIDKNQKYEKDGKTLYKLDNKECLDKLDYDISKTGISGGNWYIDIDLNPYLVFEDYDTMPDYIKKDIENNMTLMEVVKYF